MFWICRRILLPARLCSLPFCGLGLFESESRLLFDAHRQGRKPSCFLNRKEWDIRSLDYCGEAFVEKHCIDHNTIFAVGLVAVGAVPRKGRGGLNSRGRSTRTHGGRDFQRATSG
jgi:hypothetical protein